MSHHPFKGTARFEVRRHLGAGTAGAVYEAWDRERQCLVALKLLHQSDPASLYRFKQEFRALAHLSHPNLIQLYELQNEDDQWFVIMELVDGVDFVSYVRSPEVLAQGIEVVEGRLRPAARQLGRGLSALHASGRLHRDVKPSNVLVTNAGKLVLLDFGLVTKATQHQTFQSFTEDLLGTPIYMAPEQGRGQDLTEATDWYGVGTLIYEALTGKTPFGGQLVQVMLDKQRRDPTPPRRHVPEISRDLDELCQDLLRRDADLRPPGTEVLERLGAEVAKTDVATASPGPGVLVGRQRQQERLWEAFAKVLEGKTVTLYVHGASGLGKSALVQRFLLDVRHRHPDTVTLSGRCYEHESVPYKAFDNVVDMLTRYLRSLPVEEAAALLPRDVLALARLFPVLRRVRPVADAERRVLEIPDSLELRRRAFAALREILTRMGEDHPLVLFIDDLQWGDFDSAGLLAHLMRPPDPPPMLWVGAYRDEDAATSVLVRELRGVSASSIYALPGEDLAVAELEPGDAEALAGELLGEADVTDASPDAPAGEAARRIALESRGNPLFIEELVRHRLTHPQVTHGDLGDVFRTQLAKLPGEARRLLEVLAVAGQPIEIDVARRAARLQAGELSALTVLRVGKLARSTGSRGVDGIETFHDRIEKAVLAEIDPARRRLIHQNLALELESSGHGDSEALAHHFAAAGENARALEYAAEAAHASTRALAFNRAARLYRLALTLEPATEDDERRLRNDLAEVLVSAGRSADAAEVFLRLAKGAPRAEALEMRRRAAEKWLVSGHVEQGLEALRQVLGELGWELPDLPRKWLPGLVVRRAWSRLRGYRFKRREPAQISAEELARIDTCWSAALGLGVVNTLLGAAFQARHLALALAAGESFRVARALALEVGYTAAAGRRRARQTRKLLGAAGELARRVDDPYIWALTTFSTGLAGFLQGRWKDALGHFEEAEALLRERCTGVAWEIDNVHFYTLMTLSHLGRLAELLKRLPAQLKEARERGDLYVTTSIRTRIAWAADLAADEPEQARDRIASAVASWSREGFHLQHLWSLFGRVEALLYAGRGQKAWAELDEHWQTLRGSLLMHIENTFVDSHGLRARTAVAAAAELDSPEAEKLLRLAERGAKLLTRRGSPWSGAVADLVLAGVASVRGRPDEAAGRFSTAEQGFTAADMTLHATVARLRMGQLLGGDEGREMCDTAAGRMTDQGVVRPERIAAQMAPCRLAPG